MESDAPADTGGPQGVKVAERWIPFPESISPEARAALIRQVRHDGMPFNALSTLPASNDHSGWMALQQTVGLHYARAATATTVPKGGAIETLELGEAKVHRAVPDVPVSAECALIDLHGGAFVFGGGEACRIAAQIAAYRHQVVCYGVDYRMPPQHPYPDALDDCLAAYRYVLARHQPGNIIIAGRSAGGNLAAAMVLRARDEGLPLPAALALLSPELDLTESGDSFQVSRTVDVVLPGSLMAANLLYADGADLAHPYLSPLFGEVATGFPPTFLQAGTRDLFLSSVVRMHRRLRQAHIEAELHVFEAMPHGGFGGAPEDLDLASEVARFVRSHWAVAAS